MSLKLLTNKNYIINIQTNKNRIESLYKESNKRHPWLRFKV